MRNSVIRVLSFPESLSFLCTVSHVLVCIVDLDSLKDCQSYVDPIMDHADYEQLL